MPSKVPDRTAGYADAIDPQEARTRFTPQATIERTVAALYRWKVQGRDDLVRRARIELARYGVQRY